VDEYAPSPANPADTTPLLLVCCSKLTSSLFAHLLVSASSLPPLFTRITFSWRAAAVELSDDDDTVDDALVFGRTSPVSWHFIVPTLRLHTGTLAVLFPGNVAVVTEPSCTDIFKTYSSTSRNWCVRCRYVTVCNTVWALSSLLIYEIIKKLKILQSCIWTYFSANGTAVFFLKTVTNTEFAFTHIPDVTHFYQMPACSIVNCMDLPSFALLCTRTSFNLKNQYYERKLK